MAGAHHNLAAWLQQVEGRSAFLVAVLGPAFPVPSTADGVCADAGGGGSNLRGSNGSTGSIAVGTEVQVGDLPPYQHPAGCRCTIVHRRLLKLALKRGKWTACYCLMGRVVASFLLLCYFVTLLLCYFVTICYFVTLLLPR
jgi:hypothetical protein